MNFTKKNIKYADLVVPFTKCPFDDVEEDCPFTAYWKLSLIEKQLSEIENLSDEELEKLQLHHRKCVLFKVQKFHSGYSSI